MWKLQLRCVAFFSLKKEPFLRKYYLQGEWVNHETKKLLCPASGHSQAKIDRLLPLHGLIRNFSAVLSHQGRFVETTLLHNQSNIAKSEPRFCSDVGRQQKNLWWSVKMLQSIIHFIVQSIYFRQTDTTLKEVEFIRGSEFAKMQQRKKNLGWHSCSAHCHTCTFDI